jgi:hypothetical protein
MEKKYFRDHVFEEIEKFVDNDDGTEMSYTEKICVKCSQEESFIHDKDIPCVDSKI